MPYLNNKNLLFIHIPKCAGKSFEVATGIISESESKHYKWRSFINRFSKFMLILTRDKKSLPRLWGTYDTTLALQHLTFNEIQMLSLLDKHKLNNSIKVAIVRNTYDRVVSSFHHMRLNNETFENFVERYYSSDNLDHNDLAHKRTQLSYLTDFKGNIVVDNIIRFEFLKSDFNNFINKYKIESNYLPHLGKQRNNVSYKEFYNEKTLNLVNKIFKDDIEYFKFKF